jgi:hypothetical protein
MYDPPLPSNNSSLMLCACGAIRSHSSVQPAHTQVSAGGVRGRIEQCAKRVMMAPACRESCCAYLLRIFVVSFDGDAVAAFAEQHGIGAHARALQHLSDCADGATAEWGENWGVLAVLLREAESCEQQQQPQHLEYIQPSPYSNFVTVAHHTIVPSAMPGHPSPSERDAPSSCEFLLSPPHASPSCIFRLVLLPDHRAAIRSDVARCTFSDSSSPLPPALPNRPFIRPADSATRHSGREWEVVYLTCGM